MKPDELTLAVLSVADGAEHSPVQVQKALFLTDDRVGDRIGGPHFNFAPYHYGPFDKRVYGILEQLAVSGDVEILSCVEGRRYKVTPQGQRRGNEILGQMPKDVTDFIRRVSEFVRRLSFAELVSAIYSSYPAMRANSIFRG